MRWENARIELESNANSETECARVCFATIDRPACSENVAGGPPSKRSRQQGDPAQLWILRSGLQIPKSREGRPSIQRAEV